MPPAPVFAKAEPASPATPEAPRGSDVRSFFVVPHADTALTDTCLTGFLPSVVLATNLVWTRLPAAHEPVIGLYGYVVHVMSLRGSPPQPAVGHPGTG
jgi:hypothetical protein